MALIDTRGFNLNPNILGNFSQGMNIGQQATNMEAQKAQAEIEAQVRNILGGARTPEFQPQTQQEQQLAEQSQGLGSAVAQSEQPKPVTTQEEKIRLAQQIDPSIANKQLKELGLDDSSKRSEMSRFAAELESIPFEMRSTKINERVQSLKAEGRDSSHTEMLLDMDQKTQDNALLGVQLMDLTTKERFSVKDAAAKGAEAGTSEREFNNLIKDFSKEDQAKARKIKAGLKGRATGSAIQTINEEGTAVEVGETSAIIKQREKFGEMTGASRAKTIDKGFEKLVKIDLGIRNIDKAIKALDEGASTGVMQSFSPSIRASSVELDNIRNILALDVLNAATFGALSENELRLVKETALPTKLKPAELKVWLQDRKAAEQKLKAYYQEQIDFLDQGGTVAGFLRAKRKERGVESTDNTQSIGRFKVRVK